MGKVHELGRYQAWWWSPGGTDSLDRKLLMSVYQFAVRSHGLSGARWRYYQYGRLKGSLRTKALSDSQTPVPRAQSSLSLFPAPSCLRLCACFSCLCPAHLVQQDFCMRCGSVSLK